MNVAADEESGVTTNTKTFEIPVTYTVVDEENSTDVVLEGNSPVEMVKSNVDAETIVSELIKTGSKVQSNLTEEQKEAIKDGASTKIVLVVSDSAASEKDKNTVNKVIEQSSLNPILLMDIELLCTVTKNDIQIQDAKNITETESEITISVKVPDEYINTDGSIKREYHIVRLHYNESGIAETEVIPATFDSATKMITFKTNKFSLYGIAYKDTKVESEYVYIPSKNKKPVVNTFGLNISVTNGLKFNKDNTESSFSLLMDNNDFDGKVASVTVSGLELVSEKGDKVTLNVDYDSSTLYLGGEYPINVQIVDDAKKTGVYKGTLKVTVHYKEGVALVGDTVYQDLQEAFNGCASDSTVILLKNIKPSGDLQIGTGAKNINFNTNGKTVDGGDYQVYTAGDGLITIYGGGIIKNNNTSQTADHAPLKIFSGSNVVLDGVSIEGLYCGVKNSGNLTVKKANITAETFGIGLFENGITTIGQNSTDNDIIVRAKEQAIAVAAVTGKPGMVANVYGGLFETAGTDWDDCPVYWAGHGTINVYGGTFKNVTSSTGAAGILQKNGTVNISDGVFEAKDGIKIVAQVDSTEITTSIVGGNFTGTRSGIYIDASNSTYMGQLTKYGITIDGSDTTPTFIGGTKGAIYAKIDGLGNRKLMSINGGVFSSDPTNYVVNALVKQNANGTYTVESLSTDADGNYLINDVDDLILFEKIVNEGGFGFDGKTVKLTSDISLQDKEWTPVGINADGASKFRGIFDGQNHIISKMTINQGSDYHAAGFFGALNGTVKNIVFENATATNISAPNSKGNTDNGTAVVAGSIYTSGTIENVKVKNSFVSGNRYVGGISGYTYGSVKECTVENTNLIVTPDDLTGSYDNGDKAGGIVGAFWHENTYEISGNTVSNVTITGYRDLGGIAGYANGNVINNTVNGLKIVQDYSILTTARTTVEGIVGRHDGFEVDNSNSTSNVSIEVNNIITDEQFGATLKNKTANNIVVNLAGNVKYDITPWIGGNGTMGSAKTNTITINGNSHAITFNNIDNDWNGIYIANEDALLTINNANLTNSGYNDGPWNRHDIYFQCKAVLNNIVSDKSIAVAKDSTLNNVNISDDRATDDYLLWIQACGETVNVIDCNMLNEKTTGTTRGIKIADQYVDSPSLIVLNVSGTKFVTTKKAAVLVTSTAGATINWRDENNISGVVADSVNAVWNDADRTAAWDLVTVTGCTKAQEQN